MNGVVVSLKESHSCLQGGLVVHLDVQHAVLVFPVVDDADVLDAQLVGCQDRGDGGDSAGLVDQIAVELVHGGQDARLMDRQIVR